jgi:hypothetical protein
MANDKTYDRHVNIWINGKEVSNDISSIKKEMLNLTNQTAKATRGSDEYNQKVAELRRVKAILKEHQDSISATGGSWNKVKGLFSSAQGIFLAGLAGITTAYQGLKGVITSTDSLGDAFTKTVGGWKGGLDALARSLATISEGGLKNLGKKIREGIDEGRRYAESLDQIDEKMRALKISEAETSNEILRQTEISRSAKSSKEEQIAAGKKIIELEDDLATIRTGIAQQAFENESTNIEKITKLTRFEIIEFARQKEWMVANIEKRKEYNQMIKDRDVLQAISLSGVKLTQAQTDNWTRLNAAIKGASDETKYYAYAAANMPGDEKMQLYVDKYVEFQQAMGSGLENTMRTRIRTAKNEDQLNKDEIKGIEAKQKAEQDDLALKERMERYTDEYFQNEEKRNQKDLKEKELMEKYTEEYFQKEQKRQQDDLALKERMEQYTEEYFKKEEERDKKRVEAKIKKEEVLYRELQALGNNFVGLESALYDRQFTKLDEQYKKDIAAAGDNAALKTKIEEDYAKKKAAIARKAAVAEKLAALFSIAIQTAVGIAKATSEGILGWWQIPLIIASGVIQAATVAAKPLPAFFMGGDTGPGGKHQVKGYVHANEWVANADMVASPVTGPIIRALEDVRVNGSYANGGGPGMSSSGSGAVGSSSSIIATDPELKVLIRQNTLLLSALRKEGVSMKFGYKEADNVQQGLDKLSDIRDKVSI